jgi:2-succinyl-5-enolpyruvyl-6-hydroxy-3-cyclohexene-1-carboxylate synthase
MIAPNRNTLWAQVFVDELVRAGLQVVCIAPGSRSTPLALAFAEHPGIAVYSLLDERSAAFFALGMALAGQKPVALVCTSGTATANFHPAIIEACYAQIPLLVLTTDRPHELRHSGANQTIDQVKMYGDHVRWFVEVAPPEANPSPLTLRSLRTLAGRAMATAAGIPAGPVHLNFPFRKPLEPTPVPGDGLDQPLHEAGVLAFQGRDEHRPFTAISRGLCVPSSEQLKLLVEAIRQAKRGLIICGPRCPGDNFPEAISQLARVAGYPILADALSGVRFGPHLPKAQGLILGGYETFLQRDIVAGWEPPDLILRFGGMPISQALADYLAGASSCRQVAIHESGTWQDDTHTLSDFIWADPETICRFGIEQLATDSLSSREPQWAAIFRQAETQAQRAFEAIRAERFFEGAILAEVVKQIPAESLLYVASSLPVRHLDQFVSPRPTSLRVLANRGASGIDGTIASALGAAAAADRPLVLVIGDLAFYHDMNSLLALQRCKVKATIVLINNNGGGIFHRLPIAKFEPPFTELFVTPHGLNFEPVVRMFGADYVAARTQADLRPALQGALAAKTSQVIEVFSDSVLHEQTRREINQRYSHYQREKELVYNDQLGRS